MNEKRREQLNGKVEVPAWAMACTYVLCWAFSAALFVSVLIGHVDRVPIVVGTAIYLLLWPVIQINPADMLRKLFGGS